MFNSSHTVKYTKGHLMLSLTALIECNTDRGKNMNYRVADLVFHNNKYYWYIHYELTRSYSMIKTERIYQIIEEKACDLLILSRYKELPGVLSGKRIVAYLPFLESDIEDGIKNKIEAERIYREYIAIIQNPCELIG